jgi:hypothetical protein
MKRMADDHCDLGEHVEDHTLVLNILRGLNKKYDHVKRYLKRVRPFPSFHDVHNDLLLEELTLAAEASLGSTTALATSGGQQQRPSPTPVQQYRPPSSPAPFGGPQSLTPPALAAEVVVVGVAAAATGVAVAVVVVTTAAVAAATTTPLHRLLARVGAAPPDRPSTTLGPTPST